MKKYLLMLILILPMVGLGEEPVLAPKATAAPEPAKPLTLSVTPEPITHKRKGDWEDYKRTTREDCNWQDKSELAQIREFGEKIANSLNDVTTLDEDGQATLSGEINGSGGGLKFKYKLQKDAPKGK